MPTLSFFFTLSRRTLTTFISTEKLYSLELFKDLTTLSRSSLLFQFLCPVLPMFVFVDWTRPSVVGPTKTQRVFEGSQKMIFNPKPPLIDLFGVDLVKPSKDHFPSEGRSTGLVPPHTVLLSTHGTPVRVQRLTPISYLPGVDRRMTLSSETPYSSHLHLWLVSFSGTLVRELGRPGNLRVPFEGRHPPRPRRYTPHYRWL